MASRAQVPLFDGAGQPWKASRKRAAKAVKNQITPSSSVYEAAGGGRRTLGWRAPTTSANLGTLENLATLRDRSRQAVRNDGWAFGIIEKLVNNTVGTGIKPLSQSTDPEFRRAVQELWATWTDYSDADGSNEWYGQQTQAVRCYLEAGEVFVRLRPRLPSDGLPVPLQVQIIEPELCPHLWNGKAPNGNNIRAGIEFSPIGQRVAYYFYAQRPGDIMDFNPADLRRIDASQVLHVFKQRRPGQLRGIPHLTQALIRLRGLDFFDDATLLRQQLSAMFVAFLKHPVSDSSSVIPIMGEASLATVGDRGVLGLQPGTFQELQAGEEVEFSKPPDVMAGYIDFIRQQLRSICAAGCVPFEILTGDMTGVNDRTVRVNLNEFHRYVQAEQQMLAYQLCFPLWAAWMDAAERSGALVMPGYYDDPQPWRAAKWMGQRWQYIQPVQDAEATRALIRSGLISRSDAVSELGEDSEVIDAQQAADNERADRLKLSYDSDGRHPATGASAGVTVTGPAPGDAAPPDPNGDPGGNE